MKEAVRGANPRNSAWSLKAISTPSFSPRRGNQLSSRSGPRPVEGDPPDDHLIDGLIRPIAKIASMLNSLSRLIHAEILPACERLAFCRKRRSPALRAFRSSAICCQPTKAAAIAANRIGQSRIDEWCSVSHCHLFTSLDWTRSGMRRPTIWLRAAAGCRSSDRQTMESRPSSTTRPLRATTRNYDPVLARKPLEQAETITQKPCSCSSRR